MSPHRNRSGSPFAPHSEAETAAMLETLGVGTVEELFDIPASIRFDDSFDISARSEADITREVGERLATNDELVCLLGRGHYGHYVPAVVDDVAGRSEFLTSYTQYQPEVSQGYLQALFEYQSMLVELTGMDVANASLYDAATALGEAATFADRLRQFDGDRVLVPEHLSSGRRSVLENYCGGFDIAVESYPMADGAADTEAVREAVDGDCLMIYAETPTIRGVIEPSLRELGDIADAHDSAFCVGTDLVALGLLEPPAAVGADIVVGDASCLGLPTAFGMGLGLFATREEYLRQVPGRLVGVGADESDTRAFTLTLQTREQHIRRERATSNICTNQAWVALRTAIHLAWLGPDGLAELARRCVAKPSELAARLDALDGVSAPVHDQHHFREFAWRVDDAPGVAETLRDHGYAVHVLDEETIQTCLAGVSDATIDDVAATIEEVVA